MFCLSDSYNEGVVWGANVDIEAGKGAHIWEFLVEIFGIGSGFGGC